MIKHENTALQIHALQSVHDIHPITAHLGCNRLCNRSTYHHEKEVIPRRTENPGRLQKRGVTLPYFEPADKSYDFLSFGNSELTSDLQFFFGRPRVKHRP